MFPYKTVVKDVLHIRISERTQNGTYFKSIKDIVSMKNSIFVENNT